MVERGSVALIGNGPDFFIAVKHHHEWGTAHTVWGEVLPEDMPVVDALLRRPLRTVAPPPARPADPTLSYFETPIEFSVVSVGKY